MTSTFLCWHQIGGNAEDGQIFLFLTYDEGTIPHKVHTSENRQNSHRLMTVPQTALVFTRQKSTVNMGCAASKNKRSDSERRRKLTKKLIKLNKSRLVYVTKALEGESEMGIEAGKDHKFLRAPSVLKGLSPMAVLPEEESFSGEHSEMDELEAFAEANRMSVITLSDLRARAVDPADYIYEFENLVFEGGGMKGIGYCGAIRYLEELEIMHQINNFAGTSVGALVAVLLAMGYSSKDMEYYLREDIGSILYDASCGVLSIIPNLICLHGWHAGRGIYEWLGQKLNERTGSPDTTFMELYHYLHKGVCIVVTNLTHMSTEYCHPKTTPDMPIRLAVRMSMAIPGLYQPVKYKIQGRTNVYVDGGLLCNYPIHCYDGWYLSMKPEDSFLHRLQPLRDLPVHLERQHRFNPSNDRTIGFLLFSENEEDVLRYQLELRDGKIEPTHPKTNTKLYRRQKKALLLKERANREYARTLRAVDAFLKVLSKHKLDVHADMSVKRSALEAAFKEDELDPKYSERLFGKDFNPQDVFDILDKDNSGYVSYDELIHFIEEQGICMQRQWYANGADDIKNVSSYIWKLQGTMLLNVMKLYVQEKDLDRTVGINTGHINTEDFNMEQADQEFVLERGYNAMKAFLKFFVVNFPEKVEKKSDIPELCSKKNCEQDIGQNLSSRSHDWSTDRKCRQKWKRIFRKALLQARAAKVDPEHISSQLS